MKVLLVTANFHPDKTGISVTATDCAEFMSKLGNQVTVICGMPYYPEWKIRDDYRGTFFRTEKLGSLRIKRTWLYVPSRPSSLKRILHELSFSFLAFFRGLVEDCDLVLCVSPPLTSAFMARLLASLRRKEFWAYIQDIQPDAAIGLGMLRNKMLNNILFAIERYIYRGSKKILILSHGMEQNLLQKGVEGSKISVVPVSIDVRELSEPQSERRDFWDRHGLTSKYVVTYSGNLGVKQDPAIIVECARLLQSHGDIYFAIVGDGAMKNEMKDLIEKYSLSNVSIYPLVERCELGSMLQSSEVLLAPQRKDVRDMVMPSKLLMYFTSRRPVIASTHPESEVACLFRNECLGYLVEPEKPELLAQAVLSIKACPDNAREAAERAYEYVLSNHSHEAVFDRYYRPLFALDRLQKNNPTFA